MRFAFTGRMDEATEPTRYRVEHRPPDGDPRVLATSTLRSVASASAREWRRVLRRRGERGAVVVVAQQGGQVIYAYALEGS